MEFDDLLEDYDDKPKSRITSKPNPVVTKKKVDNDGWDDDDFGGLEDMPTTKPKFGFGSQTPTDPRLNNAAKGSSKPFGFGGVDGLKKEPMNADDEDEWGLDASGPSKEKGAGGRLLGRKPKKDDDDDLEGVLGEMEAQRGIQEEKKPTFGASRPKTANVVNNHWQSVEEDTKLLQDDDAGDPFKAPLGFSRQGRAQNTNMLSSGAGMTTSKNELDPNPSSNILEGNASMGSHGSGIELIDIPNSRQQRKMIRPPTGGAGSSTNTKGNLNQIQQYHQNNKLTRPATGPSKKPPTGGRQHENQEENPLDLLEESQAAHSGSNLSAMRLGQNQASRAQREHLGHTASQGDFERAEDDLEEYQHQDSSQAEDSDSDGGFYQPTLLGAREKKKPAATKAPPPVKSTKDSQKFGKGLSSMAASGVVGGFDLQESGRKGTLNSDQDMGSKSKKEEIKESSPVRPKDPQQMLEWDIKQEKNKAIQNESQYTELLEKIRKDHQKQIDEVEKQHQARKQKLEAEKREIADEKTKTLESEKKQLGQLFNIDIENKELQYQKDLDNQRALFEDQQENLRKMLAERMKINDLAKQISDSSGNINSLINKLGSASKGEIERREDELARREKILEEKRRDIQERRQAIQSKRRKLLQETDEIKSRETEMKMDYQREKQEISADIDRLEMEHLQDIRLIRDRIIEKEVECRRVQAEVEKIHVSIRKEEDTHKSKLDELSLQKKQVQQARENFLIESQAQERELKQKLAGVHEEMKEVRKDAQRFEEEANKFEGLASKAAMEREKLTEELDRYCLEKESFDKQFNDLKEKGEQDQKDSELIGYFKHNKEELYTKLKALKADIEQERQSLQEDKVKLSLFRNELATRQKCIESLRYNYIKTDQQDAALKAEVLSQATITGTFVGIKEPAPLPPQAPAQQAAPASSQPRFNYDEFMKNLTSKLQGSSLGATKGASGGADFQAYLMREKENYQRSMNDFQKDTPLVRSIQKLRGGDDLYSPNNFHTQSVNSLQQMSKGLDSEL